MDTHAGSGSEKLRELLQQWKVTYSDDSNSIEKQLVHLLMETAAWESWNAARRHSMTEACDLGIRNPAINLLLDRGHFVGLALGIRRLAEQQRPQVSRRVHSIRAWIDDVLSHVHLLSRGNFFGAAQLPYEFEAEKREAILKADRDARSRGETSFYFAGGRWSESELLHDMVDRLCGINDTSKRSSSDCPQKETFEKLKVEIERTSQLCSRIANKFIAHAATKESREHAASDSLSASRRELNTALMCMVRAARFLALNLLNIDSIHVPIFNESFDHLDKPMVTAEGLRVARRHWDHFSRNMGEHGSWNRDRELDDGLDAVSWDAPSTNQASEDSA